jgi:hypothetical protein
VEIVFAGSTGAAALEQVDRWAALVRNGRCVISGESVQAFVPRRAGFGHRLEPSA